MKCPKCENEMPVWNWDIGVAFPPVEIDIAGHYCCSCQLVFVDLDKSEFDGFILGGKLEKDFCLHCGKSIRGLVNAPEIAIHQESELRRCAGGRTHAEFAKSSASVDFGL